MKIMEMKVRKIIQLVLNMKMITTKWTNWRLVIWTLKLMFKLCYAVK